MLRPAFGGRGVGLDSFAFGGRGVFEFGRDFYGFFPLSGFAISPAGGRETKLGIESVGWLDDRIGRAKGPRHGSPIDLFGGLGWWFSGRNHFVAGGVWLDYPP